MSRLFLPQTTLEEWAASDRADLRGEQLVLTAENVSLPVVPAVHFLKLVSGPDEQQLLSKVKTLQQLKGLGAEQVAGSVVLGDTAYEVAEGYVTTAPMGKVENKAAGEADLLAAFLLDRMPRP